jgi:hypothetical protein
MILWAKELPAVDSSMPVQVRQLMYFELFVSLYFSTGVPDPQCLLVTTS